VGELERLVSSSSELRRRNDEIVEQLRELGYVE